MANWKCTVDISDLYKKFENGTLTIEQVAKEVYNRCMKTKYNTDTEFVNIISGFLILEDIEKYDDVLMSLYDYADVDYRLWIEI